MRSLDPKGICALVIVLTFGIVLVTMIVGIVVTGRSLGEASSHLLSTICGALIGVLSTYIGGKVSGTEKGE